MRNLVNLLFEIGSLRKIMRAHRQMFVSDDLSDNIASHSHRVTAIGYFLARQEKANVEKVLIMCTFHDLGESRSGDQNWVHKRYVKVFEDEILEDQLKNIEKDDFLYQVMKEYEARETVESKIAKDADKLDQILLVKEYILKGNQEAPKWIDRKENTMFYSETARKLFEEIIDSDPADWWKNLWVEKRR